MSRYYINQIVEIPSFIDIDQSWADTMFMITRIDPDDEKRKYAVRNRHEITDPNIFGHWPLTTQIGSIISP